MHLKKYLTQAGILILAALFFAGCGKKSNGTNGQAFENASPAIKSIWDQAVAADKTNDYYTAATGYNKLVAKETDLTSKQFNEVLSASRDLMQRMMTAADNGDAAAKQALAKLMAEQHQ